MDSVRLANDQGDWMPRCEETASWQREGGVLKHDFVSCSRVLGADALVVASADTLHSDDRNPEICLCVSRWSTHGSAGTLKLGGVIDVEDDDGDMEWNGTSAWSRSMEWQAWNTVHGHGHGHGHGKSAGTRRRGSGLKAGGGAAVSGKNGKPG